MRLQWLQHVPFEGLGSIQTWARLNDCACESTRLYEGQALPGVDELDWLVVMGGPMGVHDVDRYPWLRAEKRLIERAIDAGKTVLGVCLGAQLIAEVLGAEVYRNRYHEIGWHRIYLTDEGASSSLMQSLSRSFMAFHWHGDTFDVPSGCTRLATSEACANQAFQYGDHVLALQFHLESSRAGVEALIDNCADDLIATRYVQTAAEIRAQIGVTTQGCWNLMGQVLTNLKQGNW